MPSWRSSTFLTTWRGRLNPKDLSVKAEGTIRGEAALLAWGGAGGGRGPSSGWSGTGWYRAKGARLGGDPGLSGAANPLLKLRAWTNA